ncbi:MAG: UDP-glucose 4-epimerase GalE [Acidiferrobacterales bacterium]
MTDILVAGGAGYVGSHMVKLLLKKGHGVTTLDNLSSGYRDAVVGGEFIEGDLADQELLEKIFVDKKYDEVIHFASHIQVGESVQKPGKYYRNNFSNTLNLLDTMARHGITRFIFSSSAAVYGVPENTPVDEKHPKRPINPYGLSKWMVEQALENYDKAYGLKSTSLRYFNVAGADPGGELGERHDPETHLIPLVLQVASGRREDISIYGRDYPTKDGTCIRDYIHVSDLCDAHLLALEALSDGASTGAYNLGNENGFSVQEVIDTAQHVTGRSIKVVDAPRRTGDPPVLVAAAELAKKKLGWEPRYPELETIIEHAWEWEKRD